MARMLIALMMALTLHGLAQSAEELLADRLRALPPAMGENRHIERKHDNLVTIGIREHVGYLHLRHANPGDRFPGAKLLVPGLRLPQRHVSDGLVVNLPELMVYRWQDDSPVAFYPVSVGMAISRWHTPIGLYTIGALERNPTFYWYGGVQMDPGPRNPLGDRWIGLSDPGYGLHGTNNPNSIGRFVSHGCIRMYPAHVRRLFDEVSIGLPVMLTYDTVNVGYAEGVISLAVFPDVYRKGTNTLPRAKKRLESLGVANLLLDAELAKRLRQTDGVARPILGSRIKIAVNGEPAELPLGPVMHANTLTLPTGTLARLFQASTADDGAAITFHRAQRTAAVPRMHPAAFTALDTQFLPIRPIVESLGGTLHYADNRLTITLPTMSTEP